MEETIAAAAKSRGGGCSDPNVAASREGYAHVVAWWDGATTSPERAQRRRALQAGLVSPECQGESSALIEQS